MLTLLLLAIFIGAPAAIFWLFVGVFAVNAVVGVSDAPTPSRWPHAFL